MSDYRVASRYAKSLIDLASEKGILEEVHNDMLLFSKTCKVSREFELILKNPIINHAKKLSILRAIFGGKVNALSMAIFEITTRKNREAILSSMAASFHDQYNKMKNVEVANITTAIPLEATYRTEIENYLAKTSGKKVEIVEKVDADLIGGYILRVEDRQIDNSIKARLQELKQKFSDNPYISKL
jgi:F-type H+-transporting ATPase subunit delta